MIKLLKSLLSEDDGATSVEYAVMLMLIAGICISVIQALGGSVEILWSDNISSLNDAYDAHNN